MPPTYQYRSYWNKSYESLSKKGEEEVDGDKDEYKGTVHAVFSSNFSQVRMFYDYNHPKLLPESTGAGVFPILTTVDSLHKKVKSEYLIIE